MEDLRSGKPPEIADLLAAKRGTAEGVFDHFGEDADLIVGLGNGEPATVLDAIEARGEQLSGATVHQMLPLRKRRYMHGDFAGLRHVSWFLSPSNREAFHEGTCDLVPNNFSDVPHLMNRSTRRTLALAAASPPDRHGYFSLGTHAEYMAAMIGEVPFFLGVNYRMPRTFGENQVHISQVVGWCEADYPLIELPSRPTQETDRRIAAYVAERIPDGATLQAGIGAIPNEVLALLGGHRRLGVHSELLSDGFVDLVERGVLTGAAVTTFKNIVDCVVTEYGVAELRGSSIRERARKLISIAHPKFREGLMRQAREMGYS